MVKIVLPPLPPLGVMQEDGMQYKGSGGNRANRTTYYPLWFALLYPLHYYITTNGGNVVVERKLTRCRPHYCIPSSMVCSNGGTKMPRGSAHPCTHEGGNGQ